MTLILISLHSAYISNLYFETICLMWPYFKVSFKGQLDMFDMYMTSLTVFS